jgi:hypothetical protein
MRRCKLREKKWFLLRVMLSISSFVFFTIMTYAWLSKTIVQNSRKMYGVRKMRTNDSRTNWLLFILQSIYKSQKEIDKRLIIIQMYDWERVIPIMRIHLYILRTFLLLEDQNIISVTSLLMNYEINSVNSFDCTDRSCTMANRLFKFLS